MMTATEINAREAPTEEKWKKVCEEWLKEVDKVWLKFGKMSIKQIEEYHAGN